MPQYTEHLKPAVPSLSTLPTSISACVALPFESQVIPSFHPKDSLLQVWVYGVFRDGADCLEASANRVLQDLSNLGHFVTMTTSAPSQAGVVQSERARNRGTPGGSLDLVRFEVASPRLWKHQDLRLTNVTSFWKSSEDPAPWLVGAEPRCLHR